MKTKLTVREALIDNHNETALKLATVYAGTRLNHNETALKVK